MRGTIARMMDKKPGGPALPNTLELDAGPSGWMQYGTRMVEFAEWEMTEHGDEDDPESCRGWFRCPDPRFAPIDRPPIRLYLRHSGGGQRIVDATIIAAHEEGTIWEFKAAR